MSASIDKILELLDNGTQRSHDPAYPTEVGDTVTSRCWRCGATATGDLGTCDACRAWMACETDHDPALGHMVGLGDALEHLSAREVHEGAVAIARALDLPEAMLQSDAWRYEMGSRAARSSNRGTTDHQQVTLDLSATDCDCRAPDDRLVLPEFCDRVHVHVPRHPDPVFHDEWLFDVPMNVSVEGCDHPVGVRVAQVVFGAEHASVRFIQSETDPMDESCWPIPDVHEVDLICDASWEWTEDATVFGRRAYCAPVVQSTYQMVVRRSRWRTR